jgi:translocation and assembly module TamB
MDDVKGQTPPVTVRKSRKRRFWKALGVLALLAIVVVVALPWLLGTPPGRSWVVGRINAQLAPGSIELEGLGLSWTGPIELAGVALRDPQGKLVLGSRRLILDRGILGLLTSRPDYGTITIEGATIDVERHVDGTIDVLEAIASALKSNPAPQPVEAPSTMPSPSRMAVSIFLKGGTLRIVSPELVEPITAGSLDGSVTIAPGKPIELAATLGDEGRSLEIRSTIDPDASGDRSMVVTGKNWPIHILQGGVKARGRFEGTLDARQEKGLWVLKGDAAIVGVEAAGPALLGDTLRLDKVVVTCDSEQSATGWTIRKFELTSPVATLQGGGSIPAIDGTPAMLRGRVDLASLAKMLPNAMRLRDGLTLDQGTANVRVDLTSTRGSDRVEIAASLDDFAATEAGRAVKLREPVRLTGRASRAEQKVTVETIEVKAAGIDVKAGGDLQSGVKLEGTVDLVAVMAQLRDVLDLGGYDLSGHARLAADYRHAGESFKGRFAADCKDLKIIGATAEPIVRDSVRLDASALGSVGADGMPGDWRQAQLDLKAGDLKLDMIATSKDANATIVAGLGMDVASPTPGRLEVRGTFQSKGSTYEFDELRARLQPSDPKAASGALALAVRGRVDLASGEGVFEAIPGSTAGTIGLELGGAKVSGLGRSDLPLRVDAALLGDLAAIDRMLASWSGSPLKGLGGVWSSQLAVTRSSTGKLEVDGKINVPNIVAPGLTGAVAMAVKGGYSPDTDRLDVSTLDLLTGYGHVVVAANLLETKGRKLLDLTGTIEPNWATIDALTAASVEHNARFRANIRPIHLAGSLKADSTPQLLNQIQGEIGLDLTMAEAFGVVLSPAPVVLKLGGGQAKFEPIRTKMNDGPVVIQGELALDNDNGLWLRLGPSRVDNATINEAVSNSILAYAAPVMARSSEVTGKVTVAIAKGMVPITAVGPLSLDGAMALQNTVFNPGTLGAELATITGQTAPRLKIDQAMNVQVLNRRVNQNGLVVPIGGDGFKVAIDGSVGFDETLDLKATVALTARALGLDPKLEKAVAGSKIAFPVRGTLNRPAIDRKALNVALKNAVKGIGEKELKAEAGRFLDRIANPKPTGTEPRSKPARRNPLGDLENLGREILDPKKP